MIEKAKHTPTPWLLGGRTISVMDRFSAKFEPDFKFENGKYSTPASPKEIEANAAFAHRAVNSHDALVAALKDAIDELDSMCVEVYREGFNNPEWNAIIKAAEGKQ